VFSERTEPISELVKGKPGKPLREPVLVLFAGLLNLYQVYALSGNLAYLSSHPPLEPEKDWFHALQLAGVLGLMGFTVAFTVMLVVGAAAIYFLNRRVGGAFLVVVSIVGLMVSVVGIWSIMLNLDDVLAVFVSFLSPVCGLLAGYYGIRGEKVTARGTAQEIV
jgi:hypothetical protein